MSYAEKSDSKSSGNQQLTFCSPIWPTDSCSGDVFVSTASTQHQTTQDEAKKSFSLMNPWLSYPLIPSLPFLITGKRATFAPFLNILIVLDIMASPYIFFLFPGEFLLRYIFVCVNNASNGSFLCIPTFFPIKWWPWFQSFDWFPNRFILPVRFKSY